VRAETISDVYRRDPCGLRVSFQDVCCAGADVNVCPAVTPASGEPGRWST